MLMPNVFIRCGVVCLVVVQTFGVVPLLYPISGADVQLRRFLVLFLGDIVSFYALRSNSFVSRYVVVSRPPMLCSTL